MSFKLRKEWGPVACSMSNGVIVVEDGLIPDITVDEFLTGLVFEKQQISFMNYNVQCLLRSEKYVFVLRWDGSYTVYIASNNAMCALRAKQHSPVYEFDKVYQPVLNGGIINSSFRDIITSCTMVEFGDRIFLFCDNNPIVGRDVDKNSYYFRYCKSNENPVKPDMKFGGDGLLYMDTLASTPVEVKQFYNLTGNAIIRPKGSE